MNKSELIEKVAQGTGQTKAHAGEYLNRLLAVITAALQVGEEIRLIGFGTFSVVVRAARAGRNPQNGKTIKIAARTTVKFRPGKSLKATAARTSKIVSTAPGMAPLNPPHNAPARKRQPRLQPK